MSKFNDAELNKLRHDNFTDLLRDKFADFNGYTLTTLYGEKKKEIDEFEVYDDDIWVTSYPKCGTTWTQEMVWCVANNADTEAAKSETLLKRFPMLEFFACLPIPDEDNLIPHVLQSIEFCKNFKRPRFIKCHLPWDLLPRQIRNFERRPRIIYVIRNPKDACVSFYHHHRLFHGYTGNLEDFSELYMGGKIMWSPVIKAMLSYFKHRNEPNVHILRFEDMKTDHGKVIRDVAKFLKVTLTDEQVATLVDHLSFASMKTNESCNYENMVLFAKALGISQNEGKFLREGQIGTHKNEYSPEMIKRLDEWIKKETAGTGLEF